MTDVSQSFSSFCEGVVKELLEHGHREASASPEPIGTCPAGERDGTPDLTNLVTRF